MLKLTKSILIILITSLVSLGSLRAQHGHEEEQAHGTEEHVNDPNSGKEEFNAG